MVSEQKWPFSAISSSKDFLIAIAISRHVDSDTDTDF